MKNSEYLKKWKEDRALKNNRTTVQDPAESYKVSKIIEKYQKTGEFPQNSKPLRYEDLSNVMQFEEAMNVVAKGTEAFEALPGKLRDYFDNDVSKFLDAVDNGFFNKKETPSPILTEDAELDAESPAPVSNATNKNKKNDAKKTEGEKTA